MVRRIMQGPLNRKTTFSVLAGLLMMVGCTGDSDLASSMLGEVSPGKAHAAIPPSPPIPPPEQPSVSVHEERVRPGDALVVTLGRAGLAREDANAVVAALAPHVDMRRIRPGDLVAVTSDEVGQPQAVEFRRSLFERVEARPNADGGWDGAPIDVQIDKQPAVVEGTIDGSLYETMGRIGESPALATQLASIFEWDFDFRTHTTTGDRFRMVVELEYVDDEFVGYGDILMAQYETHDGRLLTAVGFEQSDGDTLAYYDASGESLQKMFLKAPLTHARISSGFTHARRHPILGTVRPHLAIDYAAPYGTPVRSVAVGTVTFAGWKGGNGKCVMIRHPRGYETMYDHLSSIAVKRGARVEQGELIGKVGSTGLSTGPHLHYGVRKNGRWVNPLGEKFVPGEPVSASRRTEFRTQLAQLTHMLDEVAPLDVDGTPAPPPTTMAAAEPASDPVAIASSR